MHDIVLHRFFSPIKKEVENMLKHLFFDLDDTLIKCSGVFYDIEDIVAKKILEYTNQYTYDEIRKKFNEKQFENLEKHGYGPQNFECSLMQATYEIVGYDFFKDNLQEFIRKEASVLYSEEIELIDGAKESIEYLYNKGYEMSIITKGMEDVQKKRVEALSIKNYFKDYHIVKHKLKSDYEELLKEYSLKPEDCYMIGNSPKGDINEAKKAGLNTIYIPNEHTWNYEDEEISIEDPKTSILKDISEIRNIL
jgi:putative hydrolase of the HAD superfamily